MSETLPDGESQNLRLIAERIRTRRTTKLFLRQKVSKRLIREAIEVARWAPNHHLTEPWHFYLLGPDTIEACAKLIGDLVRETKGDEELAAFKERSARSMPRKTRPRKGSSPNRSRCRSGSNLPASGNG